MLFPLHLHGPARVSCLRVRSCVATGVQVAHLLCRVLVGLVDACGKVLVAGEPRAEALLDLLLAVNQGGTLSTKEMVAEVWPRYAACAECVKMSESMCVVCLCVRLLPAVC
jgi:hypothetical protein